MVEWGVHWLQLLNYYWWNHYSYLVLVIGYFTSTGSTFITWITFVTLVILLVYFKIWRIGTFLIWPYRDIGIIISLILLVGDWINVYPRGALLEYNITSIMGMSFFVYLIIFSIPILYTDTNIYFYTNILTKHYIIR